MEAEAIPRSSTNFLNQVHAGDLFDLLHSFLNAKQMENPNITDEEVTLIGQRYGLKVDPDDATHFKLCMVINMLENQLQQKGEVLPNFDTAEKS